MEKIDFSEERIRVLSGVLNRNLISLEKRLKVSISARGDTLIIKGEPERVRFAKFFFQQMLSLAEKGYFLNEEDFRVALDLLEENQSAEVEQIFDRQIRFKWGRRIVKAKSLNQQRYIQAIKEHDIVFAVGPAGTGKTYLAMAMALYFLFEKRVGRIILTRPAVEAGEKLGFLPGDMFEKVNPYLRPLYDALYDLIDAEKAARLLERGVIEIAPLAFMRGRTLNDSFIILDEAQNTTSEQMKMFLTRIGFDSKAVITGDVTQIDLPKNQVSGMVEALEILDGIEGIAIVRFTKKDVVRHPLVQEIIRAYEQKEKREKK